MKHALEIKNLQTGYAQHKLVFYPEVFFEAGVFCCLIGKNGTGKSTFLRTLAGLAKPLSGSVKAFGEEVLKMPSVERAKKIAVVLTEGPANQFDVLQTVAMGRYPHSNRFERFNAADKKAVEEAIDCCGLQGLENKKTSDLSDGQRQKTMIARAIAQETPILLLDEPTAFLDLPTTVGIMKLLKKLCSEKGKAVLMSTHELEWAANCADELLLLDDEGGFFKGSPQHLAASGQINRVFDNDHLSFDPVKMRFSLK